MPRMRKKYSSEFKSKVALSAIREEGSLSELSSRYGVTPNMISRWKQQALSSFSDIFSNKQAIRELSNDHQVKELHAKIGELMVERDFLVQASKKLI